MFDTYWMRKKFSSASVVVRKRVVLAAVAIVEVQHDPPTSFAEETGSRTAAVRKGRT